MFTRASLRCASAEATRWLWQSNAERLETAADKGRALHALLLLLQLCVPRLCLLQQRHIGIRVLPKREEVLIGGAGLDLLARSNIGTRQTQLRKRDHQHEQGSASSHAMRENMLKFLGGVCRSPGRKGHLTAGPTEPQPEPVVS